MKNKPRWIQTLALLAALLLIILSRAGILDPSAPEEAAPPATAAQHIAGGQLHWGNPETLQDHFKRHGADFDATDPEDYARQAHAFYLDRERHQVKTDTDGAVRVYDAATNAFGAYRADGAARTYFKPDNGQAYFDRQPGN